MLTGGVYDVLKGVSGKCVWIEHPTSISPKPITINTRVDLIQSGALQMLSSLTAEEWNSFTVTERLLTLTLVMLCAFQIAHGHTTVQTARADFDTVLPELATVFQHSK